LAKKFNKLPGQQRLVELNEMNVNEKEGGVFLLSAFDLITVKYHINLLHLSVSVAYLVS